MRWEIKFKSVKKCRTINETMSKIDVSLRFKWKNPIIFGRIVSIRCAHLNSRTPHMHRSQVWRLTEFDDDGDDDDVFYTWRGVRYKIYTSRYDSIAFSANSFFAHSRSFFSSATASLALCLCCQSFRVCMCVSLPLLLVHFCYITKHFNRRRQPNWKKKHSNNSNPIERDECMDVCVCKAMFQYIKVCRQINCIERNSAAAAAEMKEEEEDSFALSHGCSFAAIDLLLRGELRCVSQSHVIEYGSRQRMRLHMQFHTHTRAVVAHYVHARSHAHQLIHWFTQ